MITFETLESRVQDAIGEIQKLRAEKQELEREVMRLKSQCTLLTEENVNARRIITQNNVLIHKQKKIKERIDRLWETIAHVV